MLLLRNTLSVLVLFALNIRYRLASQEDGLSKKLTAGKDGIISVLIKDLEQSKAVK